MAKAILIEAKIYEMLRLKPHENIAKYHDCEVSHDGRITGLYWTELNSLLMQHVNPQFKWKRIFRYNFGSLIDKDGMLQKSSLGSNIFMA